MSDTKIQVVPYSTTWPFQFKVEAHKIADALGDNCITVHHVGSTAIEGLWAKPIIDIIPVVKDVFLVDQQNLAMQALGYVAKGEHGMLFRRYFQRVAPIPACNVHVYEEGSGEIERLVLFRDFLNQNAVYKEKYADLKRKLGDEHNDITRYTLAKDALVKEIDSKTGFKGYRMVHALTEREWELYHRLFQTNPSHPDVTNQTHQHIVLYQGTEVVGAALVSIEQSRTANIKRIAIDGVYQSNETVTYFKNNLERWLKNK